MAQTINEYIDSNWVKLTTMFAEEYSDEWGCEEQLMKLQESEKFTDFCERKMNEETKNEM